MSLQAAKLLYVLHADISDEEEDEEPFTREKFEGVFSSLATAETYIRECVSEDYTVLDWQPIVTFEHIPVLQADRFKVHIVQVDEGTWRSFQRLMEEVIKETKPEEDMNLYSKHELKRLESVFAMALGLSEAEFNTRYSETKQ